MAGGKIAQNTSFFTIALAVQKVLSFLYFVFIARSIGVADIGRYSLALSFSTIFAMLLDFGLTQVIIRESARGKDRAQRYINNVLGLKLVASVLIYVLMAVSVTVLDYPLMTRQMVYIAGLFVLFDSFAVTFYGVLRGQQKLAYESIGVVINQMVVAGCGLFFVWLGLSPIWLITAYVMGSLFNMIYGAVLLKKIQISLRPRLDWPTIRSLLAIALPFALAGVFIRVYSSMDVIFLSKLAGDEAVGIYSVAYKVTFAFQFVAVAFSSSVYPAFCRYYVESKERLATVFVAALRYLLMVAMPLSVGIIMVAPAAIGPVFGWQYQLAVPPLQILMVTLVFIFLTLPIGALLNAADRQARNTWHLGIVAGVNIILNMILVPIWSYTGAAVATLLSYGLLLTLGLLVSRQIIYYHLWPLVRAVLKIGLACALMAIVVALTINWWPLLVVIPLGMVAYLVGLYLSRGITSADLVLARSLILKK